MNWLALDVGGANVKAADGRGYAASVPLALWKDPRQLAPRLRSMIAEAPAGDRLAVTMTGELADCFSTKTQGVRFILEAVEQAAGGRCVRVYLTDGRMAAPADALREPLRAAASNWHALARYAGRYAPQGPALLIDIGSTTTDIVPLFDGRPIARGADDTERLMAGELVYTGVERTPLCGILRDAPYRGRRCPVAQEVFATALDAYLVLGEALEEPRCTATADGRSATRRAARRRLGRMICASDEQFEEADAEAIAQAAAGAQVSQIADAAGRVAGRMPRPVETVVASGQGEFLIERVMRRGRMAPRVVLLSRQWGTLVSRCAPAHALAVLARETGAP